MADDEQFTKYLDMICAMSIDCRMGGIAKETYIHNLEAALRNMKGEEKPKPARRVCLKNDLKVAGRVLKSWNWHGRRGSGTNHEILWDNANSVSVHSSSEVIDESIVRGMQR